MSPWFYIPTPNPHARLRLFCFPYAGGSAAIFRDWGRRLGADVEVVAIQLPGRGARQSEPALRSIKAIVDALREEIVAFDDRPFIFFGHSNGALIAYELARALQVRGDAIPDHLIVSAKRAPHLRSLRPITFNLPQKEFVDVLREYEGTPKEILEDADLLNFLLPTIRADFSLSDLYQYTPGIALGCDLSLLGSLNDKFVPFDDLLAWSSLTIGLTSHKIMEGGHFFIHSHCDGVLAHVNDVLAISARAFKSAQFS